MRKTDANSIVFVVDDEASVRKAIARLLKASGYLVETFGSAREFLDHGDHQDSTGCVLADLRMPGLSGLELQQELKTVAPAIPVIFVTGHGDVPTSVHAMKNGAADFLTKPVDDEDLLRIVRQALARSVEDRERYAELRELQRRVETLTPREHEVMLLVVRGLLNKQVAAELGTVEKTIKVHRARVLEKMGVDSIAELVRAAERLQLLPRWRNAIPARPASFSRPARV